MAGRGRGRGDPFKRVVEQQKELEPRSPGLPQMQSGHEPRSPPRDEQDPEQEPVIFRRPTGRGRGFFPSSASGSGISSSFTESSVSTPEIPSHLQVAETPDIHSRGRGRARGGPIAEHGRGPGEARPSTSAGLPVEPGQFVGQFEDLQVSETRESLPEPAGAGANVAPHVPKSRAGSVTGSEKSVIGSERYFRAPPSQTSGGSTVTSGGSAPGTPAEAEPVPVQEPVVAEAAAAPVAIDPVIRKGTKGTLVPVMTNFVKLRVTEGKGLFQYKVQFQPTIDGMIVRRKAMWQLEDSLGKTRTFDGTHIFLPYQLDQAVTVFETFHPSDHATQLKVQLEFLVKLSIEKSVYFYNVLFRRAMDELKYVEMSNKYFDPSKMINMAEHKLEIWPGFSTAVQEFEGGLQLCVDSASRVLRQTTLYDYMVANKHDANYKQKILDYAIGKTVLTRYNNKTYKVDDIGWDINPMSTFNRKGTEVTYAAYFQEHHGINILDLKQPLVCSKIKPRKNDPMGEERLVMLIPETCFVTGMTEEISSNHLVMRSIMGITALSPPQRLEAMKRLIISLKENAKVSEMFKSWGLEVCGRNTQVDGRILAGPSLCFNEKFSLKNAGGDFSRDATTNQCYNPVALKKWLIFCTAQDKDKAAKLLQNYRQVCAPLGIKMAADGEVVIVKPSTSRFAGPNDFKNALRDRARPAEVQFLVAILPQARDDLYAAVKRQCLIETSIPSQCILTKTLLNEKRLRSVMQKVALQINAKLGGALWALNVPLPGLIMFVGVDTHHDPRRKNKSVLAMVSTLNSQCTLYYSRVVFQTPHQESSDALKSLYAQGLAAFFEENHAWPDRVVVFRDGISDGQLDTIRDHEVVQLKEATHNMCKNPNPVLFSYIVVQKRINERIFTQQRGDMANPLPGTLVDHTITRRYLYDFFLVSQLVRQGTVTPSHFIVLEDSGENNPDLMQRFSFVLAFMYFNWPGTIRGPAMCQYAHKLAMLVGQHLNAEPLSEMEKKLYYL